MILVYFLEFFEQLYVFWQDRLMHITRTSLEEIWENPMYKSHHTCFYGFSSEKKCKFLMLSIADSVSVEMGIEHR